MRGFRMTVVMVAGVLVLAGALGAWQLQARVGGSMGVGSARAADDPAADSVVLRDQRHTNSSPYTGPIQAQLKWKFRSTGPGESFRCPVLGPDGVLYTTCGPNLLAVGADGRELWLCPLRGYLAACVLGDGVLYVAAGRDQIFGVSLQGEQLWSFIVPGEVRQDLAVDGQGRLLCASHENVLYTLNADGTVAWTYGAADYIAAGPLAAPDGGIYIAVSNQGLVRLSSSGSYLGIVKLEADLLDEFKPMPDGKIAIRTYSKLAVVRPDGEMVWSQELQDYVSGGLLVRGDGTVLFCNSNGALHAYGPGGTVQWHYKLRDGADHAPVLGHDGMVAIAEGPGALTVLDFSGQVIFTKEFDNPQASCDPLLFAPDGTLFATAGGWLLALGQDGAESWRYSAGGIFATGVLLSGAGDVLAGCTDGNLYAVTAQGAEAWRAPCADLSIHNPALTADGGCVAPSGKLLRAFDAAGRPAWDYDAGVNITTGVACGADGVCYVGTDDGRLLAVRDGRLQWNYQAQGRFSGSTPAIAPDGTVYIGSADLLQPPDESTLSMEDPNYLNARSDGQLYAVTAQGQLAWSFKTGQSIWSGPALGQDGTVYVASTPTMTWSSEDETHQNAQGGVLFALSPAGQERWRAQLTGMVQDNPALAADGTVYITTWVRRLGGGGDGNLYAYTAAGVLKWSKPCGGIGTPLVDAAGTVYCAGADLALHALAPDGQELWQWPLGQFAAGAPALSADGTLYLGCSDGFLYAFHD